MKALLRWGASGTTRWAMATALMVIAFGFLFPGGGEAATITIVNLDEAGQGLNDATPVAPMGGNTGSTRGAQVLEALTFAASIMEPEVDSAVEIRVGAGFVSLSCSSSSGVLGSAGPTTVHRDFSGALRSSTWYVQALANSLAGVDLDPDNDDVSMRFNNDLGNTGCLPSLQWYLGLDGGATPGQIDLVSVVLHELTHGLGFLSLVDVETGTNFTGLDDAYSLLLEDHSSGLSFPEMSTAERVVAGVDTGDLHWTGSRVVASSSTLGAGVHATGHVEIYAPNPLENGSSVSHFSNVLSPDELMEPAYTGPNHDPGLALDLFVDLGWGLAGCGNGVVAGAEQCDDGNNDAGDCCSPSCSLESNGSPCEDGDACSSGDVCDGSGGCVGGQTLDCIDSNPCTDDTCDTIAGCQHLPNFDSCDDGLACTSSDTCANAVCSGVWACGLDLFKLYKAKTTRGASTFVRSTAALVDQFDTKTSAIVKPLGLANPVDPDAQGVEVPTVHLECYKLKDVKGQSKFAGRRVQSSSPFGNETLDLKKAVALCLPSALDESGPPTPVQGHQVDAFKCYKAKTTKGTAKFSKREVMLVDQFESKQTVVVKPVRLCSPVSKDSATVFHPDDNLECYKIKDAKTDPRQSKFAKREVFLDNLLGAEELTAFKPKQLCVPTLTLDLGSLP